MAKKGGYQMVVLATLTYAQASAYLECGKPLLIYDGTNKPYFADSIEKVGDNIVIRKSGQTIVVDTSNNVVNGVVASDVTTKKIYCHPVQIKGTLANRQYFISCLIFNNDSTPFANLNDFITKVKPLIDVGAVIMCTGYVYNGTDATQSMTATCIKDSGGNTMAVFGLTPGGDTTYYSILNTIETDVFTDGVNAIN